jgi:adenylate cyclase
MADLFISYAKPDRPLAIELADELRGRGFSVWIDQGGIGGAKNWSAEIVESINACSTFIVLLSPDSIASHNVAKEVQLASEKRKNILPVVVEKVVLPAVFEYPLVGLQRVYYHDRPAIVNALELLKGTIVATEHSLPVIVPTPDDRSVRVAVLPFDDLSPKHDNQWFADGMMDELISTLGHLENMKVPPRSDVLHYRERHEKTRVIANELGVRYIIEGAVRKAGKKIRINTSLIDTHQSGQLWADQFDGSFHDVFAFQESVSKSITEALKLSLTPEEQRQVEEHGTENAEAYELYLKGRHEQYYLTKESYERALELYEQAAALDPNFAQAYIGAASVCCVYYRECSRNSKWLERAEINLAYAERISGETSKSLYISGMIEWLKCDDESAITILTRSAELDPKNYNAFNVLGGIYMAHGNYHDAAMAFERVIEIVESPMAYFNFLNALKESNEISLLRQSAQKALAVFDQYLLREPEDNNAAVSRGFVISWEGNNEEAEETAIHLLDRMDELSGQVLYSLGCLFETLGKPESYVKLIREAINRGYRDIEQLRNHMIITTNDKCHQQFEIVIAELEELIKIESA